MSSETEVTSGRNPGDLLFSLDNELITVKVASSQNIAPGDPVTFNSANLAIKATDAIVQTDGFGVCVHEGVITSASESGTRVIQIATGNAYVTVTTGGNVKPLKKLAIDSSSQFIELPTLSSGSNTAAIVAHINSGVARSYGAPDNITMNPSRVAANKFLAVRLGQD